MKFVVGDKVVCINIGNPGSPIGNAQIFCQELDLNRIYTIKKIEHHFHKVHFRLEEFDGCYIASRFDGLAEIGDRLWEQTKSLKEYRAITEDFEVSCESKS